MRIQPHRLLHEVHALALRLLLVMLIEHAFHKLHHQTGLANLTIADKCNLDHGCSLLVNV